MRHGKFLAKRKYFPIVLWGLLILAILGMSFGGVRAYLSASADSVSNSFSVDVHPTITVSDEYKVTVSNTDYAVYLRAAVVVNWKSTSSDNLLAAMPMGNTDYTLEAGENWFKHTDGFYYYRTAVQSTFTTTPVVTLMANTTQTGYSLVANVAVQAIQAVGTTDGDNPIDAVQDAWGISASQIAGGSAATP